MYRLLTLVIPAPTKKNNDIILHHQTKARINSYSFGHIHEINKMRQVLDELICLNKREFQTFPLS